jgi:hypothetical protein
MIAELTVAIGAPKWAGLVSNRWNRIGGDRGKLGANVSLRPDGADYAADPLAFLLMPTRACRRGDVIGKVKPDWVTQRYEPRAPTPRTGTCAEG